MKKVMRISEILNTFAGVAKVIFRVAALLVAACVAILLFVSPHHNLWRNADYTLQLGSVTLDMIPDGAISPASARNGIIAGLLLCIPLLLLGAKFLHLIQEILTPMSHGKPFDRQVSVSLRKLSFITLIAGFIYEAGHILLTALRMYSVNLDTLFNTAFVSGYTVNLTFDGNFIFVFAALYLMSHVFRYGEELQQLSDETL